MSSARVLDAMWLFVSGCPCLIPTHVWLVVGLGVDRIVDALRLLLAHPPGPATHVHGVCGGRGVVVCVGLLVPVSSQTVAGLPLLAYQPSSLLGAYQNTEVSCGDLILKMVSRLDAFSGYPSRT